MPDITQLALFKQRDIEKMFAACVFSNPIEALRDSGWLKPDILTDERIRRFWKFVNERIQPNDPDASGEVINIAMETELIPDVLDWTTATFMYSAAPYAREISRRNFLVSISPNVAKLAQAIGAGNDAEARLIVRQMAGMNIAQEMELPDAFDVAVQFDAVVKSGLRSVETYIPKLDEATGGLERQTLTILAARPSTGKTALAWQIARQAAYSGKSVLFFSLEMSSVNLWARAACPLIGSSWRDVRAGKLNDEQKQRLLDESYKLAAQFEDKLRIVDSQQATETAWQMVAQSRPDLVIVDHLRLLKDQAQSEVKRLGDITQRLKDMAKNFGCGMLLLAQLNRQSEIRGKDDKRPILADLRDSGQIEENADLVLMLHRDADDLTGTTELWVRKFRDGPRDILIRLRFDPKQEWFT